MGKRDNIIRALQEFTDDTEDVVDVGVVTKDGLMLAAAMSSKNIKEQRLAAVCAATTGLCQKNNQTFGNGELEHVIIKGAKGYLVVMLVPDAGASLVATTNAKANLGMLLMGMRDGVEALSEVM